MLPGGLGCVLEMVQPRDQRPVEHLLHACYVGLDGSAGEGFGGFHVGAGRGGRERSVQQASTATLATEDDPDERPLIQ